MRKTRTTLLAALALALPALAEVPAHPDKLTYPPFVYTPPSAAAYRTVLTSGPVAYVAEDRELPLVTVSVTFRGGKYLDPAGKEGLADLAGYLLARGGAGKRSAEELEERLAFLAANLTSSYGDDRGTVTLNLLTKDLDEGLAILRDVLTQPRFQEDKLKLRKDQLSNDMKTRNDDTADIEGRERGFLAYGEGFYANRYPTKASLEAIGRDDVVGFHRRWVDPRNAIVAASGNFGDGVSRAQMLKKLDALLGKWPFKGEAAPPVPKPSHAMKGGLHVVDKDVNQGRVSVMLPGLLRTDPDFFAAQLMNDVLGGGGFTSRITNRVRSDEGLAYSAGSRLAGGVWYPGILAAGFQSKSRTCGYAASIVLEEMKKVRDAEVTAEELETAKRSFVDTLPRRFATKAATTGVLVDEEFTGRYRTDPGYYASFKANVEKVSAADVKRVAQRLLTTEKVTILAVGKKADLLNPDPKHPVDFAGLAGGRLVDVPLRDPFTMQPMAPAAANVAR